MSKFPRLRISRRGFLKLSALGLGSTLLAACGPAGATVAPATAAVPATLPAAAATSPASATAKPKGKKATPTSAQASTGAPATGSLADGLALLGRPTANSVALSLLASTACQATVAYSTAPGSYTNQAGPVSLQPGEPQTVELARLAADTAYFYQVVVAGVPAAEHTFHTQRAPGSPFVFTIDADPHNRDPNLNGALYALTLANALHDRPDFHINLGDTFMTEKSQPHTYAEAASTFTEMRPYWGVLGADVPLFLVNGNHEGELGWLLQGKDKNLPIWSTQLRQRYYPSPAPGGFYTGSATQDSVLGAVRDGYYAFTWGDALFVVLDPFWYTRAKPRAEDPATNWNWTLGREQYDWLKATLAASSTAHKFIFIHHLVGGARDARGGVEFTGLYEWGGNNADGTSDFDRQRPGWGQPIHALLVEHHVSVVFHGHDHVFVKQDLDGIVYQELPQPSLAVYGNAGPAAEYGYAHGDVLSSSGHLRVTVTPAQATVEYVRAYLPQDEKPGQQNGQAAYRYTLPTNR